MNNRQPVLVALAVYERRLDELDDVLEERSRGTCSYEKLMSSIRSASSAREVLQQRRAECAQW